QSRYDIDWIRERGPYFAISNASFVHAIVWCLLVVLIFFLVAVLSPFCHMLYVLSKQTNKSERSKML
ncbi:hypothetical protein PENTCL1PPCAC_16438, partial [Pristionchus entomophagus]